MPVTRYHCGYAWLGTAPQHDVLIEVGDDGRIAAVSPGVPAPDTAVRLPGLTLPGLANTHSHAFHRALRGRVTAAGTFWDWREAMYALADRLDPSTYLRLATGVYAEMVLAGITCVGEFHYLHHADGGRRYDDPNAMGAALVEAARLAGIRLTLLDTCYLTSTVEGDPLTGTQLRFGDGDAGRWAARVGAFRPDGTHTLVGAALHSVRAVPAAQLPIVHGWAAAHRAPLHAHLSEQPAENDACLAAYGCTPTALLAEAGALDGRTTVVHATHATGGDLALLAAAGSGACLCPTTERDLADGVGPARDLAAAGVPLSVGSDGHSVIDLFEEARLLDGHERLRTLRRGRIAPADLVAATTAAGHRALGWADAGTIAPGARADLTTLRLDSVRTAGTGPEAAVLAATAADVTHVVVDGRVVVRDGAHTTVDAAAVLTAAIRELTR